MSELKNVKNITPFKMQVLTNFPFIEADYDAMTDYQLLCKVVEKLNEIVVSQNDVSDNFRILTNQFNNLLASVNEFKDSVTNEINDFERDVNNQIEQGFSDLNVQTQVDNKINQMIQNNEFQTLLIEAVNEINPSALNDSKKMNIVSLGGSLTSMTSFNDTVFNNNKQFFIDTINNMIINNQRYYYFINTDEDENKYYYLDITEIISVSHTAVLHIIYNDISSKVFYDTNILIEQILIATIISVGGGYAVSNLVNGNSYATRSYDLIPADNLVPFTPTNDYNPATKIYVDDNVAKYSTMPTATINLLNKIVQYIGETDSNYTQGHFYICKESSGNYIWEEISFGGSGSVDLPVYNFNNSSDIGFNQYGGITWSNDTDKNNFINILLDAHSKGYMNILLIWNNRSFGSTNVLRLSFQNFSLTGVSTSISAILLYDSMNFEKNFTYGDDNTGQRIKWLIINYNISGGNLIYTNTIPITSNDTYLSCSNLHTYNPTKQYHPATKSYVDERNFSDYDNNIDDNLIIFTNSACELAISDDYHSFYNESKVAGGIYSGSTFYSNEGYLHQLKLCVKYKSSHSISTTWSDSDIRINADNFRFENNSLWTPANFPYTTARGIAQVYTSAGVIKGFISWKADINQTSQDPDMDYYYSIRLANTTSITIDIDDILVIDYMWLTTTNQYTSQ